MRWLAVALLTIGSASAAQAQTEDEIAQAREAFERGSLAYERGELPTALTEFEASYRLTGAPDLLYNIALVHDRLGHREEALRRYREYLHFRPGSDDRDAIEERMEALDAGTDEAPDRDEGGPIAAEPGSGPGAGAWVLVGIGGALAVAGGVFLALAQSAIDDIESAADGTPWTDVSSGVDTGPAFSTIGFVMGGVGVAAIAAGVVWLLTGSEERAEVGLGPGGMSWSASF